MLKVGELRRYDGRIWRVGLVNLSRARLDPISGFTSASPVSGKSFMMFGESVNVGCDSYIDLVQESELSERELGRLKRVKQEAVMAVAAPPVAPSSGKSKDQLNAERKANLAAAKETKATEKAAAKAAKPKAEKVLNECKCGCGASTGGNFYPGHDARFKGWLLSIERGEKKPEEVLTEAVRKAYTWKKSANGKGLIPTTNYKGEPHTGYDKAQVEDEA